MNKLIEKLVNDKLAKIFADYPKTSELRDLQAELASDLMASAEDKLTDDVNEEEAVAQAFESFGDIDEVINQVMNDDDNADDNHYQKVFHEHKFDLDDDGIRIDHGKLLNIDSDGITINGGKTVKINDEGVKLGNMIINEDGIKFKNQSKASFDNFKAKFNDDDFDAEVKFDSLPLTGTRSYATAGLKTISISYQSADVTIVPSKNDEVVIREYASRSNPDYHMQTSLDGDTLRIIQGQIPHFLPLKIRVQILIPQEFSGQLRISDRSGNLHIQDLQQLEQVAINVRSGLVYARNLKLNRLVTEASSGKVVLEDVQAESELLVNSHSGVIKLDNVASQKYDLQAHSGTIKAVDLSGAGQILARSGIIKVIFAEVTGDLKVENISGTVKLTMPETDSYKFDLEAKSGTVKMAHQAKFQHDIQNLKEGIVGDSPQYDLVARAKSGTIKVD